MSATTGVGLQCQRLNHLVRLLPRISLWVIEDLRPLLGVTEAVLVRMGRLR
ncbi:MAG: hypothetical protein ACXWCX_15645 [Burkholderiales bacterium]